MKLLFALVLCLFASASAQFEEVEGLLQEMYPNMKTKLSCSALLGKGGVGSVYACMVPEDSSTEEDTPVLVERAVKVVTIPRYGRVTPDILKRECENAQIAKAVLVDPEYILTCHKVHFTGDKKKAVFIMDYVPNAKDLNSIVQDLWHQFHSAPDKDVAAAHLVRKALDIWRRVVHVLSKLITGEVKYVHGDIKPANILYDQTTSKIYLIDFGEFHKCDERGGFSCTPGFCDGSASDADKCGAYDIFSATSVPLAILLDGTGVLQDIRTYLEERQPDITQLVRALTEANNQVEIKREFKSVMKSGATLVKEWMTQEVSLTTLAESMASKYTRMSDHLPYAAKALVYLLSDMKGSTNKEIEETVMREAFVDFEAQWKAKEEAWEKKQKEKKESGQKAMESEEYDVEEPRPTKPDWDVSPAKRNIGWAVEDALAGYGKDFAQTLGKNLAEGYWTAVLAQVDLMKLKIYKVLYASLAPRTVRLVATELGPLIDKVIKKFESTTSK
eukprot:GILJ01000598.1.p1 GENE.GILJ01000598.1~~GILJ01000598.1.p1  ORF type:complete len:502 (+),score=74.10 GILJ01000598.1:1767-3272(+)